MTLVSLRSAIYVGGCQLVNVNSQWGGLPVGNAVPASFGTVPSVNQSAPSVKDFRVNAGDIVIHRPEYVVVTVVVGRKGVRDIQSRSLFHYHPLPGAVHASFQAGSHQQDVKDSHRSEIVVRR